MKRFTEVVSTGVIKDNLTKRVYVGVVDTELIELMNKLHEAYMNLQTKYDKALNEVILDNIELQAKYNKALKEIIYIGD